MNALQPGVPGWIARQRMAALARQARGAATEEDVDAEGAVAQDEGLPRCSGTTLAGEPCGMSRLRGSLFCYHHDPDRRAAAPRELAERLARQDAEREARAEAKRREAWAARLETPAQLRAFVAQVTRACWDRRIGPEDAGVCLAGARLLAELFREEDPEARP